MNLPELTNELAQSIGREFMRVLDEATPVERQLPLFPTPEQRIVHRRVERLFYRRMVPFGGKDELAMIERFKNVAKDQANILRVQGSAWAMSAAFAKVLGYGYIRRPPPAGKPGDDNADLPYYTKMLKEARADRNRPMIWFCKQMIEGQPMPVMDFDITCRHLLRHAGSTPGAMDGGTTRMVELVNCRGERTGLVPLPTEAYSTPEAFRKWCNDRGNFTFGVGDRAGITELNMIQHDIARDVAYQIVQEITVIGWHALTPTKDKRHHGIWFWRDCALMPDGRIVKPDRNNIIWDGDQGYQVAEKGVEGPYKFALPGMRPDDDYRGLLGALNWPEETTEVEAMRDLLGEAHQRLFQTLGGHEAGLMLGAFLAFAAAPEIYGKHKLFPGLWAHGEQGSGKTKVLEWCFNLWGREGEKGLQLKSKDVTPTGMSQALNESSNVPIFGDEFRVAEVGDDKLAMLHAAFDRGRSGKFNPAGPAREKRTAWMVGGETTTNDAATRSRYMLLQVARNRRDKVHEKENMAWFERHGHWLFLLTRHLLLRRQEYADYVMAALAEWMEDPDLEQLAPRIRLVHGVGYAGFTGAARLLGYVLPKAQGGKTGFGTWLKGHAKLSGGDVTAQTNINVFLEYLVAANAAGTDYLPSKYFTAERERGATPPFTEHQQQAQWDSWRLYFHATEVVGGVRKYLRQQGIELAIGRDDLRDQLKVQPYWGGEKKKWLGAAGTKHCWCLVLDKLPELGVNLISDEEFDDWLAIPEEQRPGDPRQGALFAIIQAIGQRERDERAARLNRNQESSTQK